jgi:competence ComEA-like helix-hairpin-helix protein
MSYLNNENKQMVRTLAAVFFAGVVLSLCFSLPILRHSERTVFAQAGRLNPNAATVYELAELPSLGPAKAEAIVEYRQNKEKAFEKAGDLENVKGIGAKTVEKISQWLEFNNDTD